MALSSERIDDLKRIREETEKLNNQDVQKRLKVLTKAMLELDEHCREVNGQILILNGKVGELFVTAVHLAEFGPQLISLQTAMDAIKADVEALKSRD